MIFADSPKLVARFSTVTSTFFFFALSLFICVLKKKQSLNRVGSNIRKIEPVSLFKTRQARFSQRFDPKQF
jgi:hypothetical protein